MLPTLCIIAALLVVLHYIPARRPWDRTRVLRKDERLAAYEARRGAIEGDPALVRRWIRGAYLQGVYAAGGSYITDMTRMLPSPSRWQEEYERAVADDEIDPDDPRQTI